MYYDKYIKTTVESGKGDKPMIFLEYPKCSTCQKAKKWLDAHDITYTDRHIAEEHPTYEELKEWYGKSGLPLKKFFNTSGLFNDTKNFMLSY